MPDLKFEIDGQQYDPPDLSTYDMDEAVVLYEYTGFAIEDLFVDDEDDPDPEVLQRLRHPGIVKAMLHISYQRANPTVKPGKVKELIGKASYVDAVNVLSALVAEDDAGPPDQPLVTSEQPKPSEPNSPTSEPSSEPTPESSGNGSTRSSDEPADVPPTTGTGVSVTSSPAPTVVTQAHLGPLI